MINLYQGDCLEVMQQLIDKGIKVDAVITDPPYGTIACKWDSIIPFDEMWKRIDFLIKDDGTIVLFGSEPFSSSLRMSNINLYRYDWIWEKTTNTNFAQAPYMPLKNYENILIFSKGKIAYNSKNKMTYNPQNVLKIDKTIKGREENVYRPNRKKQNDYQQRGTNYPKMIIKFANDLLGLHPTQKPLALMEYLVKTYTNEGDIVLDFTMGSGTTGLACKNLNRNFIGIELDENYFNIAKKRINND